MMNHRRLSQAIDKSLKDNKVTRPEVLERIQITSNYDLKMNRPMSSPTKLKRNP